MLGFSLFKSIYFIMSHSIRHSLLCQDGLFIHTCVFKNAIVFKDVVYLKRMCKFKFVINIHLK